VGNGVGFGIHLYPMISHLWFHRLAGEIKDGEIGFLSESWGESLSKLFLTSPALPGRRVPGGVGCGGRTADPSTAALRSGRKTFPGKDRWTQISPLCSFGAPVEMTKGRAALPLSVVAEQNPFSSPWVGRRLITSPVGMTRGERNCVPGRWRPG
jgi:hypothetical protein